MSIKLIAHRGNRYGTEIENENKPEYIDQAIQDGFYVEIDIWTEGEKVFLGHDEPKYEVTMQWLLERHDSVYLHAKNISSFLYFKERTRFNTFYHTTEDFVVTSNGETIIRETSIVPDIFYPNNVIFTMPENAKVKLPIYRNVISDYAGLIYNFEHPDYNKIPEILKLKTETAPEEEKAEADNIVQLNG